LQRDVQLRRLFEELVVTGVVPEADFWAKHAGDEVRHAPAIQRDGPASRLPSVEETIDLRKKELKIKLTPALITQIFFDHPKVRELFERTVPHKWTEQQFWQRYFKHKHFHTGQQAGSGGGGGGSNGADDRDVDAQELMRSVRAEDGGEGGADTEAERRTRQLTLVKGVNPAHDLRLLDSEGADVRALGDGSAGKGQGGQPVTADGYGSVSWTDTLKRPGEARINRTRFRQAIKPYLLHSERVMAHVAAATAATAAAAAPDTNHPEAALADENAAILFKRKRALEEAAHDSDLEVPSKPEFQPRPNVSRRPAQAQTGGDTDSALASEQQAEATHGGTNGGIPHGLVLGAPRAVSEAEEAAARDSLALEAEGWEPPEVLAQPPPLVARDLLEKIKWETGVEANGGAPVDLTGDGGQLSALPEQLRLDEHVARVHELLRHFWGCLNPRTDATDDKLRRLAPPLRRSYEELHSLKAALPVDERKPLVAAAITPIMAMLERTFALLPVS